MKKRMAIILTLNAMLAGCASTKSDRFVYFNAPKTQKEFLNVCETFRSLEGKYRLDEWGQIVDGVKKYYRTSFIRNGKRVEKIMITREEIIKLLGEPASVPELQYSIGYELDSGTSYGGAFIEHNGEIVDFIVYGAQ